MGQILLFSKLCTAKKSSAWFKKLYVFQKFDKNKMQTQISGMYLNYHYIYARHDDELWAQMWNVSKILSDISWYFARCLTIFREAWLQIFYIFLLPSVVILHHQALYQKKCLFSWKNIFVLGIFWWFVETCSISIEIEKN